MIIAYGADDFVSVAFDTRKNGDANVGMNIPQSDGEVFWGGQEQIEIRWVEFELVNWMSMASILFNAISRVRTDDANDSPRTGCCQ